MNSHGVIRLRLLGAPSIDGRAAHGEAVLKQPKRLLLLAYLAARKEFVTRDVLLGLFWPTLSEDRARRALSQAIHFLRTDLGRDSIVSRGSTELAVGEVIQCDVPEFEYAIQQGSWEAALDLYGGELLCGVIPPRTRDLEQWLDSERATMRRQATKAANTLSNAAFQAGDLAGAIVWRRRTLEISPLDESAHRDYLALLDEAGDAVGALAAFESFQTRLREVYELEPSAETRHVVDMIRSRHAGADRQAGTLDPSGASATSVAVAAGPDQPASYVRPVRNHGRSRWRRSLDRIRTSWRPLRLGSMLVLAAIATLVATLGREDTLGMELPLIPDRVAVLYFSANSDSPELGHLADGLTEALIGHLGQVRSLDVVSANGVRPFRGLAPPMDTITSRLRARTIIDGAVSRSGGKTRVTIDVIDAATGSIVRHVNVESASGDMLQIIDEVTNKVATELSPILGDVVAIGRWQAGTDNALAWQFVLTASGNVKAGDKQADLGHESEAIMAYDAADRNLEQAALLDPEWLEPVVMRGDLALGRAYFCLYEPVCHEDVPAWIDEAIGYADEALSLNEVHAGALELKGRASLEKWMVDADPAPGLLAEVERVLGAAVTLDPSRASAWAALSAANFATADFERAETAARLALEEDAFLADRAEIQMRLFQSAFHRGHDQDAERWCEGVRALSRTGNWLGTECTINLMAWSKRHTPDIQRAWLEVERGLQHIPSEDVAVIRPRQHLLVAAAIARAGDPDSARIVIQRALSAAREDPDILYYAAGAYAALGDSANAATYLADFLKDAPEVRRHVRGFRWFEAIAGTLDLPATTAKGG